MNHHHRVVGDLDRFRHQRDIRSHRGRETVNRSDDTPPIVSKRVKDPDPLEHIATGRVDPHVNRIGFAESLKICLDLPRRDPLAEKPFADVSVDQHLQLVADYARVIHRLTPRLSLVKPYPLYFARPPSYLPRFEPGSRRSSTRQPLTGSPSTPLRDPGQQSQRLPRS